MTRIEKEYSLTKKRFAMKLQKTLILVFIFCLAGFFGAEAQDNKERSPVSIEQVESPGIEHNEALKSFGLFHNFAISGSTGALFDGISAEGNYGSITQYGNNNISSLTQNGNNNIGNILIGSPGNHVSGNITDVTQEGNSLISIVNVQGNSNNLNFTQDGNSMGASINMLGNGADIEATQVPTMRGSEFLFQKGSMPVFKVESSNRNQQLIIE